MAVNFVSRYLGWLQQDNPVGEVERYPDLDDHGQTTLPGVYVAGDLTGIPLLRMAAESGSKVIRHFASDSAFEKERRAMSDPEALEVLILGAGPAGISAALECHKLGIRHAVLESAQPFQTIENFPVGKPIYAKPDDYRQEAPLRIDDVTAGCGHCGEESGGRGEGFHARRSRGIRVACGVVRLDRKHPAPSGRHPRKLADGGVDVGDMLEHSHAKG
jgi:hypothetical protein